MLVYVPYVLYAPHTHVQAAHTAAVVNELSREMMRLLEGHPINAERAAAGLNPANCVLLRGCGSRIQVGRHCLVLRGQGLGLRQQAWV